MAAADDAAAVDHAGLAERIYEAVKGLGTDEDAIFAALAEITSAESWRNVKAAFRAAHPDVDDGDIVVLLRGDLNDEEMAKVAERLRDGASTNLEGDDLSEDRAPRGADAAAAAAEEDRRRKEEAALKIQSLQRGRTGRKAAAAQRTKMNEKERREAELQDLEHRAEAGRAERKKREHDAATRIQALYRGRRVRKRKERPTLSPVPVSVSRSGSRVPSPSVRSVFDPHSPFLVTDAISDFFRHEDDRRAQVHKDEHHARSVIDSREAHTGRYLAPAKARATVESDELRTRALIEKRQESEHADLDERKRVLFLGEFSLLLLEHSMRLAVRREAKGRKEIIQTQRLDRGDLKELQVREGQRLQRALANRERSAAWEMQLQAELHGPDPEKAHERSLLFQRGKEEEARAREARREARTQEKALRAQQIRQESQDIKRTTQRRREAEVELREEDIRRQKRGGGVHADEITDAQAASVGLLPSNHPRYAHAFPRGKHALAPLEVARPKTRSESQSRKVQSREERKRRKPPHHLPRPTTSPSGDSSGHLPLVTYYPQGTASTDRSDAAALQLTNGSAANTTGPHTGGHEVEELLVEAFYTCRPVDATPDDDAAARPPPIADIPHAASLATPRSDGDAAVADTDADAEAATFSSPPDTVLADLDSTQNTNARGDAAAPPASEDHAANTRMVLDWNALASQFGNEGMFRESAAYLKKANVATLIGSDMEFASEEDRLRLRATTLNNIGCLHKRLKNYQKALSYLSVVSEIEERIGELSPATLLNLSAVHAAMGHTARGLQFARRAMGLVHERLVRGLAREEFRMAKLMAIITFHSLATCQATSKTEGPQAGQTYATALEMAQSELSASHQATKAIITGMQEYDKLATKRRMFGGNPGNGTGGSGGGRRGGSPHGRGRAGNLKRLPARGSPDARVEAVQ